MQKVSSRFQKFARYTRSLKIYAIIVVYRVSLTGPLQPVSHVIQNRHAGEQRKHWGKTNKELILFKMVKKSACLPVHCSGSSHVHFMNVAVQLANWWHMILAKSPLYFFSPPPPPLSRACRAFRQMPRSPRLAHKAPVMQARVCSLTP